MMAPEEGRFRSKEDRHSHLPGVLGMSFRNRHPSTSLLTVLFPQGLSPVSVVRVPAAAVTSSMIRTRPRPSCFRMSLRTLIPPNNPEIPMKPSTTDAANSKVEASMLYKVRAGAGILNRLRLLANS